MLTAQADKTSFLKDEAAEIKVIADQLSDNPEASEIETAVGTAYANAIAKVNTESDNVADISADRSDAYNNALIQEQQTANAERLEKAEAAVTKVDGLTAAVNAVLTAEAATTAATKAQEATKADAAGATAKFGVQNTETATYTAPTAGQANVTGVVTLGADPVISTDANGKLIIAEGGKGLEGIDALFAAIQADYNAINAIKTAQDNQAAAEYTVAELENPTLADAVDTAENALTAFNTLKANYEAAFKAYDEAAAPSEAQATALVTAYAALTANDSTAFPAATDPEEDGFADNVAGANAATTTALGSKVTALTTAVTNAKTAVANADTKLADELIAATKEVEAFDKAVNEYLAIKATADQLKGFNEAIEDAVDGIEELGYVVDDNGVGSAGNDVFVFAGDDLTITGFNAQGADVLYIGDGFAKVDLEASVDIFTSAQGSATALEVFFQQQGADAVIYLETKAFQGSAATTFEGETITLVGVDATTLQYENGAISVVEVA